MPYYAAVGCNNDSNNKNSSISFHRVPLQGEIRKKWLIAIKQPEANLPKEPYLCSAHFEPHCFNENVDLQMNELMGGKTKRRRELKSKAVPTKFAHKLTPKVRSSVARVATERKRKEVRGYFFYVLCCCLRGVATCTQIRNCVPENNNKNK